MLALERGLTAFDLPSTTELTFDSTRECAQGSGALGGGAKTGGGMLHKTFSESVTVRSFSWRDLKLTYAAPAQLMCDKGPKVRSESGGKSDEQKRE